MSKVITILRRLLWLPIDILFTMFVVCCLIVPIIIMTIYGVFQIFRTR